MLPENPGDFRIAIVGIGNELNGDDAAGVLAARLLRQRVSPSAKLLILEAGPAPESFSGPLRRFHPDLVLLVDAANLDEPPGTVRWVDWSDVQAWSGSTHTLSPTLFARFLVEELGCRVLLVGIQPEHLDFDRPVSAAVRKAVKQFVRELERHLGAK